MSSQRADAPTGAIGTVTRGSHRRDRRVRHRGVGPSPTSLLNGRYEIGDLLGAGGMGTVRRAVDHRLDRPVAIKMLRTDGRDDEVSRRRLAEEAAVAASLSHPAIAQVFDHDEDHEDPGRAPFVVMELIDGVTLAHLLQQRGALSVDETLALVRAVATALAYLRSAGVVHRDLKPANIIVTSDGRVVVVDFGLAQAPRSPSLTTDGAVLGTIEYLSPEQIHGGEASHATDLYALGLIAHHCLNGVSPFRRSSPVATAWAQLHDELPPLPAAVPGPMRALIESLASRHPDQRPDDADTVVRLIDAQGARLQLPAVEAGGAVEPVQSPCTARTEEMVPLGTRRSRRRWRIAVATAVAALAVSGATETVGASAIAVHAPAGSTSTPDPALDVAPAEPAAPAAPAEPASKVEAPVAETPTGPVTVVDAPAPAVSQADQPGNSAFGHAQGRDTSRGPVHRTFE